MSLSRVVLSSAVLALFAVGCAAAPAGAESTDQAVVASTEAVVVTADSTAGQILTDAHGISLYVFDRDTTSDSTCYDACANAWPALVVAADTALAAPLATSARRDGQLQVTLSGRPLYHFSGDGAPGDINGDGLGGVWHLARPVAPAPPAPTTPPSPY